MVLRIRQIIIHKTLICKEEEGKGEERRGEEEEKHFEIRDIWTQISLVLELSDQSLSSPISSRLFFKL